MYQETILNYEKEDIQEVTLLSIEEYEKCQYFIPKSFCWWWLRSPGDYSDDAAFVFYGGSVDYCGYCVDFSGGSVRPAFYCDTYDLYIGTKVFVGNLCCTVIDHGFILADYPIEERRFDSNSNDWEKSELYHYLNSDEFFEKIGA